MSSAEANEDRGDRGDRRDEGTVARWAIAGCTAVATIACLRAAALYAGQDRVALTLVVIIWSTLLAGAAELWQRVAGLRRVADALAALEHDAATLDTREALDARLARAPASLRAMVRARLSGVGSQASPPVAGYLLGLLVMFGLLGTFLGLFETLRGARDALTSSTDVAALRVGLAAPMQGLSRAFGTSAAGVASSAMLGLALVFVRRADARVGQRASALVHDGLRRWTSAGRTAATLDAILDAIARQNEHAPAMNRALAATAERVGALTLTLHEVSTQSSRAGADALSTTATGVRDDLKAFAADVRETIGGKLVAALSTATRAAVTDAIAPRIEAIGAALSTSTEAHFRAWSARIDADGDARRTDARAHAADTAGALTTAVHSALEATTCAIVEAQAAAVSASTRDQRETSDAIVAATTRGTATLLEEHATSTAQLTRAFEELLASQRATVDAIAERLENAARTQTLQSDAAARTLADTLSEISAGRRESAEAMAKASSETSTQLERHVASLSRHIETQQQADASRVETLGRALEAHAATLGDVLLARTSEVVESAKLAPIAVQKWIATATEERLEQRAAELGHAARIEAMHASLATLSESIGAHSTASAREVTALVTTARGALDGAEAQTAEHLDRLLATVNEHATAHGARLFELDAAVRTAHEDGVRALTDRVEEKIATLLARVGARLDEQQALVSSSTEKLRVGSEDLAALAKLLDGAIDRHREASDRWLLGIGALRTAAERGAKADAQDMLAAYLDQTREVFEHTIAFQREVLVELKRKPRGDGTHVES